MSSTPWMPFYPADYLGDTQSLSLEESGAYLHLLMAMWLAGGKLPNDPVKLARFVRSTPARWGRIAPAVMPFFEVRGDVIVQRRLEKEFEKAKQTSAARREAGARGAAAKYQKNQDPDVANAKAGLEPGLGTRARPEPEPESYKEPPLVPQTGDEQKGRRKPSVKIPVGFPFPGDIEKARASVSETGASVDVDYQAQRFVNWATSKDARYADWSAAFRNWIGKEIQEAPGQNAGAHDPMLMADWT